MRFLKPERRHANVCELAVQVANRIALATVLVLAVRRGRPGRQQVRQGTRCCRPTHGGDGNDASGDRTAPNPSGGGADQPDRCNRCGQKLRPCLKHGPALHRLLLQRVAMRGLRVGPGHDLLDRIGMHSGIGLQCRRRRQRDRKARIAQPPKLLRSPQGLHPLTLTRHGVEPAISTGSAAASNDGS